MMMMMRLARVWGCVLLLLLLLIEGWGRLMVDSVLVVYRCVLIVFWCVLLVYWCVLVVFGCVWLCLVVFQSGSI